MIFVILLLLLAGCIEIQQIEYQQIAPPACKAVSMWLSEHNSTQVPGDLAEHCLVSIPLNIEKAKLLHSSLRPYAKWQSTLPYVKDPPAGYQMPPFDFWAAFDAIGTKLSNSSYQREYQFGLELMEVFAKVHDSHFSFVPDIVGKVFRFRRGVSLVSLSERYNELPGIYVKDDLRLFAEWYDTFWPVNGTNTPTEPSRVVAINGEDVRDYLTKMMMLNPSQDLDAQYNDLFWSSARQFGKDGLLDEGAFVTSFVSGQYAPDFGITTLEFENGTMRTYEGHADLLVDPSAFAKVEDSQSFYDTFCTGEVASLKAQAKLAETFPPTISPPSGYPKPIVEHSRGHFSGYFLEGDFFGIAVLRISSFCEPDAVDDQEEFQRKVAQFLHVAEGAGMLTLMIDLRANPGGSAAVAYDTFIQLFPHRIPWGIDHVRPFDTLKTIGQRIIDLNGAYGMSLESDIYRAASRSVFQASEIVNSSNFANWPDILNVPSALHGDSFASLVGGNLSMPELTGKNGITVGGHARVSNITPPFKAADMMMIHDGLCGDMCATFSQLLRFQGRVHATVLGGGPRDGQFEDPMPYVGLTKGAVAMTFNDIWLTTNYALNSADQATLAHWNESAPDMFAISQEPVLRGAGRGGGSVNVRDSIIPAGLTEQSNHLAPVQFTVTPADCQMWMSSRMAMYPVNLWTSVWMAANGDEDITCTFGGI